VVVDHRDAGPDWLALDRLVREHQPGQLVVGLPYNVDGSPGALMAASDEFAAALASRYRLPVARVDERYSSREASGELAARRRAGARRRRVTAGNVDELAAAIILERWLTGESRPESGN
jgi:putative Holliday junction resolvase